MTNIVLIVLTNVAADCWVEWSNDLVSWQGYAMSRVPVPVWTIQANSWGVNRQFWRYTRYSWE